MAVTHQSEFLSWTSETEEDDAETNVILFDI